jgi:5'(3')-deoxyribonucleotidase
VENHLGELAFKRLILSHNKGLFTGRALIDDRLRNGVDHFKGEHIHFGTEKFPDWDSVLDYLLP